MNTSTNRTEPQPWEVHDEGLDDTTVSAVPKTEQDAIDDALGLQMISIRLQRSLLSDLKFIAEHHEVGYQPLIRDLLNRFAKSEIQNILQERLAALQQDIHSQAPLGAVDDFLAREGKLKRA